MAAKKGLIDTIRGIWVARLSHDEQERRDDMLINERPGTVQTQRQEPVTGEEIEGAKAIGGASVPDKAPHAARARTEIAATVSPQQQYVGKEVTITGQLTADAVGLPNLPINLYRLVAGLWTHSGATSTDSAGGFAFAILQSSGGTSSFKVAYPGDATFEPSVSPEVSITHVAIPTAITATASPQQQYVGKEVTITGRLTADGAPLADVPVTLYNADDIIELVNVATITTDALGCCKFTVTDRAPTSHTYVVRYAGGATFEPSVSPEVSITYFAIAAITAITATASPQQQYVGTEVTITGRLTADGAPLADVPVTLYNADDVAERASIAATSTDASGYYQFTLTDAAAGRPTYIVQYAGDTTYSGAQSLELAVTYVAIPTAITATASPQQQYVGKEVTITGRLTANAIGLEGTTVSLFHVDNTLKRVFVTGTSTAASGYYEFTLTETVAKSDIYKVNYGGDSVYAPAESTDILVRYAPRAAEAAPLKTRFALNLAWYEIMSLLLIFAGEALLFANYRVLGVGVQMLNIIAVAVVVVALNVERVQVIEALALLSLFRVVNLSFALIPTVTIYWIAVVYGVMFLPIVSVIIHEKMNRNDLGIADVPRSVLLVPRGVVVGTGFALIEHAILGNGALIPNASVPELIQLGIVMIFFVALVEALLFFVLLQPQLIERSGAVAGILITSVIFGAMHAGFANVYELLFATGAGAVLGAAFYRTRNLALVVTIQAVNNVILFGVLGLLR